MPKVLWAALGGFLGSAARYAVSGAVYGLFPGAAFPVGTLAVNVLGCLCIGGLTGLAEGRGLLGPEARVFLLIGVLGGFTTFSTFGYETWQMLRDGQMGAALWNTLAQVVLGVGAVWFGFAAVSRWVG